MGLFNGCSAGQLAEQLLRHLDRLPAVIAQLTDGPLEPQDEVSRQHGGFQLHQLHVPGTAPLPEELRDGGPGDAEVLGQHL